MQYVYVAAAGILGSGTSLLLVIYVEDRGGLLPPLGWLRDFADLATPFPCSMLRLLASRSTFSTLGNADLALGPSSVEKLSAWSRAASPCLKEAELSSGPGRKFLHINIGTILCMSNGIHDAYKP